MHWRTLIPGQLHLGYRRRKAGAPGTWIARRFVGKTPGNTSGYRKRVLGLADFQETDGRGVLSYADAQKEAHATAARTSSATALSFTVAQVVRS